MTYFCPKRLRTEESKERCDVTAINMEFAKTASTVHHLCPDIWHQIFEYFEAIELFIAFAHITPATDQVLFNANERCRSRGLMLNADLKDLPKQLPLNSVISLTLDETCHLKVIDYCSELRSLKLIGTDRWATFLLRKVTHKNTKLEQHTIVTPSIRSLSQLITAIPSILSLRRLEICTDDLEDDGVYSLDMLRSKIEQLILNLSPLINWNGLLRMFSCFTNIRTLRMGLIERIQEPIPRFIFQNLCILSLKLLEVPFDWIIQLTGTISSLIKLKLSGLVDDKGFVVDERWIHLFESAPTLALIFVNVSIEQGIESYRCEKLQTRLRALSLHLICNDDDNDCSLCDGTVSRWWNLKGVVTKPCDYL